MIVACAFCGDRHERKPGRCETKTGLMFCSRKCKDTAQRMDGLPALHPPHYGKAVGRHSATTIARRHHPYKCNRCGYDRLPILQVHHRDRNKDNNTPENLEWLCPNCHEVEHLLAGDGRYTGAARDAILPA